MDTTGKSSSSKENKKKKGQFYTTNSSYILDGFPKPPDSIRCIIEPFTGKGDIIEWIKKQNISIPIEAYDIEPKYPGTIQKDTLKNPPNYDNSWILTNPPYLSRNKSKDKELYNLYNTNDLYKCFILSLIQQNNCKGGIVIIPAGFFFSARDIDVRCRDLFMKHYRITMVRYFEETVFADTTTTVVAFSFEKSSEILTQQNVQWILLPYGERKQFHMTLENNWIIGGDIYRLPISDSIRVRRYVEGLQLKNNEQRTNILLRAIDSGKQQGRISFNYDKNNNYSAKESDRTFAILCISGKNLSEDEQINLCNKFNEFIEKKRTETWSLFLPQFRESKEYARKRIPFELVYKIVLHILQEEL